MLASLATEVILAVSKLHPFPAADELIMKVVFIILCKSILSGLSLTTLIFGCTAYDMSLNPKFPQTHVPPILVVGTRLDLLGQSGSGTALTRPSIIDDYSGEVVYISALGDTMDREAMATFNKFFDMIIDRKPLHRRFHY